MGTHARGELSRGILEIECYMYDKAVAELWLHERGPSAPEPQQAEFQPSGSSLIAPGPQSC